MAFREFLDKCIRVFKVARKPTKKEVKDIAKVSALGMLIIGLLGFIVSTIYTVLFY